MNIFKNNKTETSDDYYEAYKSEINSLRAEKKVFSFANILKVELAILGLGLFLMHQNNISLELKVAPSATATTVATANALPVSIQREASDENLVVAFADNEPNSKVVSVEIREDDFQEALDAEFVEDDVYAQNDEMKSLIESLKSEMDSKAELHASI